MKTGKLLVLILSLILSPLILFSQTEKKSMSATTVSSQIVIDGVLDEPGWADAPVAKDFIQRSPYNGRPATRNTEVKVLYDNSGMYVGAMMYDESPDSILRQLALRDGSNINADYFIVVINPFNDGLNAFCFMVFASDVQSDFRILANQNNDDPTWDAVWQSKARINDKGWVCEMKIPYSAIRFNKEPEQTWEINFQRDVRRCRETSTWNLIDSKVSGYVNQCGKITGIRNIKPPLRLSLMPYVSGYIEQSPGSTDWELSYNYGTDLKYGINQSFTLDMTLIPDFGQVPSDDKIYNFSPFEIRYDEKRQFFTEGTEMFNKGNIFYSRRIGDEPEDYSNVGTDSNEIITVNPIQTRLINASKISGRTNKGLGIGLFNAMSANTWATVKDTLTGEERRVLTQGFTNYNMIVFDQSLKNNSFLDLLNTNYYIPEKGYCANVSGTSFRFANKKFTYALTGEGFLSQKYYGRGTSGGEGSSQATPSPDLGFHYVLQFGKISGNFQYNIIQTVEDTHYDPNDMGFNARNNKFNHELELQYNIYEPFGNYLSWYNYMYANYNCLYDGLKYSSTYIEVNSHIRTRKYLDLSVGMSSSPVPYRDYYEPRVDGYYYENPAEFNIHGWFSSDYRKKLALDINASAYTSTGYETSAYVFGIEPRYRISDRLTITAGTSYEDIQNGIGYVTDSTGINGEAAIVFGRRDVTTITNVIRGTYMFNSRMSINLRARHYWVQAPYYSFYTLDKNGQLTPTDQYTEDADVNFNLFNLDLTYIWNFAPGSQLSIVWKNAISTFSEDIVKGYFKDLGNTLESPASNSFSIRLLYYLDALYLKKKS